VNVATLQPPAGAGNVVTVFVPGAAVIPADPGALTITIPDPPDPPPISSPVPPPPPPVLTVPDGAKAAGLYGSRAFPPPPAPPLAILLVG